MKPQSHWLKKIILALLVVISFAKVGHAQKFLYYWGYGFTKIDSTTNPLDNCGTIIGTNTYPSGVFSTPATRYFTYTFTAAGQWVGVSILPGVRDLRGCKRIELVTYANPASNNTMHMELGENSDNADGIDGEFYKTAQYEGNATGYSLDDNSFWRLYSIPLAQSTDLYDDDLNQWYAGAFFLNSTGTLAGLGGMGEGYRSGNRIFAPKLRQLRIIVHCKTPGTYTLYLGDCYGVWEDEATSTVTERSLIDNFERKRINSYSNFWGTTTIYVGTPPVGSLPKSEPYEYSVDKGNENGARDFDGTMPAGSVVNLKVYQPANSVLPSPAEGYKYLKADYTLSVAGAAKAYWTQLLGGGNLKAITNYRLGPDWQSYDGIRFAYKGDASYGTGPYTDTKRNIMRVIVDARGKYTDDANWYGPEQPNKFPFETRVPIENNQWWMQRYIPFSMLGVNGSVTDPFTPSTSTITNLQAIKSLTFSVENDPAKSADNNAHTLCLDNIELYKRTPVSQDKVYDGIKALAANIVPSATFPAGLLPMTFDGRIESHTYDNALVAMCFAMKGSKNLAEALFNKYLSIHNADVAGTDGSPAGFDGFYYGYALDGVKMQTDSAGALGRGCGPNAYMLIALLYYERKYGDNPAYDIMIKNIANWLAAQQEVSGKVKWGYDYSGGARSEGSIEVNTDCYAAFYQYSIGVSGEPAFLTKAINCKTWLNANWIAAQNRFAVGDSVPLTHKALDVYSLPVAALLPAWEIGDPAYQNCLAGAIADFGNTQYSLFSGKNVTGFDFGGAAGVSDKDGVWFEGTAQMAVAYYASSDTVNGDYYVSQLEEGISDACGPGAQGLSYATPFIPSKGQGPTAYGGWPMTVTDAHMASMCWYLFAKNKFNPFWPGASFGMGAQRMEYRTTNTGAWLDLASNSSIDNADEVMLYAQIISSGTIQMRFYYAVNNAVSTISDTGSDVGTSYFVEGIDTGLMYPGNYKEYYGLLKEHIHNANNSMNWKPSGTNDNGVTWMNGALWNYAVNLAGTLTGDRDKYVLVGNGGGSLANYAAYPLVWNSGGYFETTVENNYSSLRHAPLTSLSNPTTQLMTVMPTPEYYLKTTYSPILDNCSLNSSHFAQTISDGVPDIFYNGIGQLYLRASYGDIVDVSSYLSFTYGNATVPTGAFTDQSLAYYNRDLESAPPASWKWVENIVPNSGTYTEAQKHQNGQTLHFDFLEPADYAGIRSLPEGTTVYYYFKVRDENDGGNAAWRKELWADKVEADGTGGGKYFTYTVLEDDYTRPYVVVNAADASAMQPRNITDSGNGSWLNTYAIEAILRDENNGIYSSNPALYGNMISGRGANSGIYRNPNAAANGSVNNPVHDTRVYYVISSSDTTNFSSYSSTDKYLTSVSEANLIPNDAPETNEYDLNDANGDGKGYAQMDGPEAGGKWTGKISLKESYIGKYVYYRVYVCNDDNDPEGFIAPSANYIDVLGSPVVGAHTIAEANNYNNHGVVGTPFANPWDLSSGGACDTDRDHGWAMYTRYGGQIGSPKLVKIQVKATINGVARTLSGYLNADGGVIGNVVSIENGK